MILKKKIKDLMTIVILSKQILITNQQSGIFISFVSLKKISKMILQKTKNHYKIRQKINTN